MAESESVEIAKLNDNLKFITDAAAGNLQWFANGLVEKRFIIWHKAQGILQKTGVTPAEKVGELLGEVYTIIQHVEDRGLWFNKFVAIFEPHAAYSELVKCLRRSVEGNNFLYC